MRSASDQVALAAVKCILAKQGFRGRFSLHVKFVEGMDRVFPGQLFHVAGNPTKQLRFVSTTIAHGDANAENWFMLMHIEPISCDIEDLNDVFLVSFDERPGAEERRHDAAARF